MGLAADLDGHRLEASGACFLDRPAGEDRPGDALEAPLLPQGDEAAGMLHGDARGDAAAGRAAVDLAGGEDADIGRGIGGNASAPSVRMVP